MYSIQIDVRCILNIGKAPTDRRRHNGYWARLLLQRIAARRCSIGRIEKRQRGILLQHCDWARRYSARTWIFRDFASGFFAMVTVSTPFLYAAVTFSGSTLLGNCTVRWKVP